MNRKPVSLKIDSNLWMEVKAHCIINKLKIPQYIEKLIDKDLKSEKS